MVGRLSQIFASLPPGAPPRENRLLEDDPARWKCTVFHVHDYAPLLVTTSWFGRASEQFANRNRITLINGAELKQLIKEYLHKDVTAPRGALLYFRFSREEFGGYSWV